MTTPQPAFDLVNAPTDCTFGSPSLSYLCSRDGVNRHLKDRLSRRTAACGCAYVIAGLCTEGVDGAFCYCLPSDAWD